MAIANLARTIERRVNDRQKEKLQIEETFNRAEVTARIAALEGVLAHHLKVEDNLAAATLALQEAESDHESPTKWQAAYDRWIAAVRIHAKSAIEARALLAEHSMARVTLALGEIGR